MVPGLPPAESDHDRRRKSRLRLRLRRPSSSVTVLDAFFLLLLCFTPYVLVMSAQLCGILLLLGTPVSARILALVLRLHERNGLRVIVAYESSLWTSKELSATSRSGKIQRLSDVCRSVRTLRLVS